MADPGGSGGEHDDVSTRPMSIVDLERALMRLDGEEWRNLPKW